MDPGTGADRLAHTLRRRRRLRRGAVQLGYVAAGLGLALVMPVIDVGPQIDESRFGPVLVAIAGGLISFIALVFSLLFLIVQYGNTALSPRLNLYRDSPLIWHAFAMFVGVFVFCATSAVLLSGRSSVTLLVPVMTVVLVVVALALMRRLQLDAFRSLQLGGALHDIDAAGRRTLTELYGDGAGGPPAPARRQTPTCPPIATTVVWDATTAVLRQVDVPRMLAAATVDDVVVELAVMPGEHLMSRRPVLTVHGHRPAHDAVRYLAFLDTGLDRTFDQDPLLAFRLLSDIALRAVSAAVNDPATAVEALDHVESLLGVVVDADLTAGPATGPDGQARVLVRLPSWEDYLSTAVDEIAAASRGIPTVERRLTTLLEHLRELAPEERRAGIDDRIRPRRPDADARGAHVSGVRAAPVPGSPPTAPSG